MRQGMGCTWVLSAAWFSGEPGSGRFGWQTAARIFAQWFMDNNVPIIMRTVYMAVQIDIILNHIIFYKVVKNIYAFNFFLNFNKYIKNHIKILVILPTYPYNMNNPYISHWFISKGLFRL